jgi:hypothetical protein
MANGIALRAVVFAGLLGAAALPPAFAGENDAPRATPKPPEPADAARRFARAAWFDLRGRGPTPEELAAAVSVEPAVLADRLLADPATWEAWLDRELYYYLLIDRFRPVSDRVLALPARLASGDATVRDATREIVVSAEFNTRNPGNDTFVTVVLEQLLGINVLKDPRPLVAGKRIYDGYPERLFGEVGRNQSDIVKIVLGRKEFAERFVERQFRALHGKAPTKEEAARDGARFAADPAAFRGILRDWLLSDGYRARTLLPRPKSDLVFIRTLFSDLLGRDPTFEEFRNSRNAFLALSDPAPIRNVIAQLLLDSGRAVLPEKSAIAKPADWVRGEFLRLLGRAPTERETDAFVAILGEYGGEPKTIVLALVTCPEYQYY